MTAAVLQSSGATVPETAAVLGVSERAVHRYAQDGFAAAMPSTVDAARKLLAARALRASTHVVDTIDNDDADAPTRLRAAFGVLDRVGIGAQSTHVLEVRRLTDEQLEAELRAALESGVLGAVIDTSVE